MTTRLNTAIRDKIVTNAMTKAGITKERQDLSERRFEWAESIRLAINGVPDAAIESAVNKARKAWDAIPEAVRRSFPETISKSDYTYVNLGGITAYVGFRTQAYAARNRPVFAADHQFAIQFHQLEGIGADISDRAEALKVQVRAVVNSVSTVKQLLNVWPEAKELLPETVDEAKSQLPAVQVETLNALIGLPTEEQAQ